MANIPGSVRVGGFIAPSDTADRYYVVDPVYGIDGLRSVPDYADRNAIYTERRREGMVVYVQYDNTYWRLKPPPWDGSDDDWVQWHVIPAQAGNSGKLLTTDGSLLSWTDPPISLPTQTGQSGKFLTTDGNTAFWGVVTGGTGSNPGGPDTSIQYNNGGVLAGTSALTWNQTGATLSVQQGVLSSDSKAFNTTASWNQVGGTFTHWLANVLDINSSGSSKLVDLQVGGTSKFSVDKFGKIVTGQADTALLTSGVLATSRLGSGVANNTTFLRGDQTWAPMVAAGSDEAIQFNSSGAFSASANLTWSTTSNVLGVAGSVNVQQGSIATATPAISSTATWNNTSATFTLLYGNASDIGSQGGSKLLDLCVGGVSKFAIDKLGKVIAGQADSSFITSGIVATARLGSGTANNTTYLRGDQTWAAFPTPAPAGSDKQVQFNNASTMGASPNFTWDYNNQILAATNFSGNGSALSNLNASNLSSGTVAIGRLGTGTPTASKFLRGDNAWAQPTVANLSDFPAQTDNAGKLLTTDGTTLSWGTTTTSILSDFPTQTGNSGKYLSTNGSTLSWSAIDALPTQTGNAGKLLTTDGTVASWTGLPSITYRMAFTSADIVADTLTVTHNLNQLYVLTQVYDDLNHLVMLDITLVDANTLTVDFSNVSVTGTWHLIAQSDSFTSFTGLPLQAGHGGMYLTTDGASLSWAPVSTSTPPGGANGCVQFNNSGAFAGSGNLVWNDATDTLSATNFVGGGVGLTGLNASNLASGTVPVARLGSSGTPGATNFLRGDNAWVVPATSSLSDFPSQGGNSGRYLTTNGTSLSWGSITQLPSQSGQSGKYLTTNGTSASWAAVDFSTLPVLAPNSNTRNTIQPSGDYVPLALKGASNQSANLLELKNSSGSALSTFDAAGYGFPRAFTFVLASGTAATTGASKTNVAIVERAGKIVKAFAYAKTAPTGAALIFDINKNGTSIWNATQANRLSIPAGQQSATQTSFDTTSVAEGDIIEIDIDQVGSTVAGQDITVVLLCLLRNN